MDILFISPWYPDPPDNGAKIRISNLLSALCSRHHVTVIAAHDPVVPPSPTLRGCSNGPVSGLVNSTSLYKTSIEGFSVAAVSACWEVF